MPNRLPPCPCDLCGAWISATDPCGWRDLLAVYGGPLRVPICIECAGGFTEAQE